MSLFVNQKVYPKLYKSNEKLPHQNQYSYRYNVLQDFMQKQEQHNKEISNSMKSLDQKIDSHETPLIKMMERIQQLEKLNESLLKHRQDSKDMQEAIMAQLSFQKEATLKQSDKLEQYEKIYQKILLQQEKQDVLYQEIENKLSLQEAFHQTILNQIEHQQKSTQNLTDKVDYLKDLIIGKVISIKEKLNVVGK